jgi:hypothetical protein
MEVAAAAAAGAGVVELQLDLLEAAAPTEREAKRRRVHPVPAGPPAGVAAAAAAPGRRSRRRRAVQRLFQACRHVFRGPGTVPSPGEVQLLRHMLGEPALSRLAREISVMARPCTTRLKKTRTFRNFQRSIWNELVDMDRHGLRVLCSISLALALSCSAY